MALTKWAFIYTLGTEKGAPRWDELGSDECRLITVGVASVEDAAGAAKRLAEEGVQLVELCGAFGPVGTSPVVAALAEHDIPVGGVFYGAEATDGLHRIFG